MTRVDALLARMNNTHGLPQIEAAALNRLQTLRDTYMEDYASWTFNQIDVRGFTWAFFIGIPFALDVSIWAATCGPPRDFHRELFWGIYLCVVLPLSLVCAYLTTSAMFRGMLRRNMIINRVPARHEAPGASERATAMLIGRGKFANFPATSALLDASFGLAYPREPDARLVAAAHANLMREEGSAALTEQEREDALVRVCLLMMLE